MNSSAQPTISPGKLRSSFGDAIQHFREARKWTRSELARASGVSRSQIRGYERGEQWPMSKSLSSLLNALGVTGRDFLRMAESNASLDTIAEVQEPTSRYGTDSKPGDSVGGSAKLKVKLKFGDVDLEFPAEIVSFELVPPAGKKPGEEES